MSLRVFELRQYLVNCHAREVWGEEFCSLLSIAICAVRVVASLYLGLFRNHTQ